MQQRYKALGVLGVFIIVGVAAPAEAAHHRGEQYWDARYDARLERHTRTLAEMEANFAHTKARLLERLALHEERLAERTHELQRHTCKRLATLDARHNLNRPVPELCDETTPAPEPTPEPEPTPDPDPEPEPDPVLDPDPVQTEPVLTFAAYPSQLLAGATSTLTWSAEGADTCDASGALDWQGTVATSGTAMVTLAATTTYTLVCENEAGTSSDAVIVAVQPEELPEPDPEPTGALVISEVLYDLAQDGSQGSEVGGRNEWVELYNGSDAAIDLAGYTIGDSAGTDVLSTETLMLPAGGFAVVTATSTTFDFWTVPPDTVLVVLDSSIGSNGLANTADAVYLRDSTGSEVDAMSYGANEDVFAAGSLSAGPGLSVARADVTVDTNTVADWASDATASPGV